MSRFVRQKFSTVWCMASIRSWFSEHPASVDETYSEHFMVALGFSRRLAAASGAALVHAFCPSLCTTTASDRVKEMCDEMMSRHTIAGCDDLAGPDQTTDPVPELQLAATSSGS